MKTCPLSRPVRPLQIAVAADALPGRSFLVLLACVLTLAVRPATSAATIIWANVGTDFATGGNWVGSVAPADDTTTDIASFGTAATNNPTLAANRSVKGVIFANGAGGFTFSDTNSAILTLGASGISQQDNTAQTLDATLSLALGAAAAFTTTSTGALTINSTVDNGGNLLTLTTSSSGAGTIAGAISGSGGLTKSGSTNTWTLSGANSYTGVTTLGGGVLAVMSVADGGNNSGIGASTNAASNLVFDGGTLRFTGTSPQTTDRLFTLTTNGGTLDASGTTAANTLSFTNTGNIALSGSGARTLTLTGTNTGANTLAPVLGDNGGATALVKTGAGAWLISGDNTYTGTTTLTLGTLTAGHDNAFGTGTLSLNGGTLTASATRMLGNNVSFDASSTIGGTQAITFNGTLTNNLGNRTLTISNTGGTTFTDVNLSESAIARTLTISNTGAATITGTIANGGDNSVASSLIKAGTGTLTLSGTNTYTGTLTIQAGTVSIAAIANLGGTGNIVFGSGANTATLLYTGGADDSTSRNLDLAGTTGGATITNNGTGALALSGNASASLAGAKTLTLGGTSNGANNFSGVISDGAGTVSVTKAGTGTWEISGANTYTGNTSLTAGTLAVGNDDAFGTGALIVSAATILTGDGTARTLGNNVTLAGSATIGGSSNLTFNGTLTQSATTTLTISNSGVTTFANVDLSNSVTNRTLTLSTTGGNVVIAGVIANGGGSAASALTKSGAGTLTLSGANSYAGITTLSAGTLRATDASALGTNATATALTLASGTLELAGNSDTDFSRNTTMAGNTTITIDRTSAGAGVTHSLGNLVTSTNTLTVQSGPNVDANTDYGLTFGSVSLAGNPLTLNVANNGSGTGTVTFGSLSNVAARGITKTGAGTLLLGAASGTLTSGAAFTVNNGNLTLGATNALGLSALAAVTINNTAGTTSTFDLNGFNQSILSLTLGGTTALSTSVNNVATGAGTLTLGGNVTFTKATLNANDPLGSTISGSLDLGGAVRTFSIADSTNAAADLTVSANISGTSGGITKTGTGTLVLSGNNTYDATTTVSAGTLRATTQATALGTGNLALTGGTLQLANDAGLAFNRNTTLSTASSTVTSDRLTAGAGVTHTLGTLTISTNTMTLTANAGANVTSGTAGIEFGATTFGATTPTFNVGVNTLLTLGTLSDSGTARAVTKTGAGTLLLNAAATTWTTASSLTLSNGTVQLGADNALGASALTNVTVNNTAGATSLFDLNGRNQSILSLTLGGTTALSTSVNNVSTGAGTLTLGGGVTFTKATLNANDPLGSTISGLLNLGGSARAFAIADSTNAAVDLTVSADISGTGGGITKSGTGTLLLSGNNTFTGVTSMTAGTLRATTATSLGAGTLSLGGGTLELAGNSNTSFSNNTTLAAATTVKVDTLAANPGVTHTLGALTTGTFALTVQPGTNVASNTDYGLTFGATTLSGAPLTLNVANNGTGVGTVTLGSLSNAAARGITQTGAGTLLLNAASGALTSGSAFTVNNGNLTLGATNALGSSALAAVTINNTAGTTSTFNLNGNNQSILSLTLGGTTALSTSTNNVSTGAGTLTLGGGVTYTKATLNANDPLGSTISGLLDLGNAARAFAIADSTNAAVDLTVSANISGAGGGITKSGTGTLLLTGNNSFTGVTSVTAGTLRATTATSLGAGTLSLGGGTLELAGNTATNFGRNTTLAAATTIKVDTLAANPGVTHTLGTLTTGTFALTVQPGANVTNNTDYGLTFGATSLVGNPLTLNIANNGSGTGTVTLGSLSNAAARGITQTGAGTLLLNAAAGAITSGSAFTVNNGNLTLGATNALGSSALAAVTLNNTAGTTSTFNLNGNSQSILSLTLGGAAATATSVNNVATGAGTLTLGGNVTFTNTNNPLGSTISGLLNLGAATRTFTINDSTNAAADLTVSANMSGSAAVGFTKTGAGTMVLSGTNSQTGTTTVTLGTLTVNSGATLSDSTAPLAANAGILNLNNAAQTTGALSSTGATGTINLGSGHTLTVSQSTNTTYSSTLAGSGNFVKDGTGTLTLSGANTYTGTTTIANGTLSINTLLNVGGGNSALGAPATIAAGTIAIGSGANTGGLTFTGAATSDRVIDLAGTTGGATITANANVTLSGNLTATGLGSKTLTLTGTSAASSLSGIIVDNSAVNTTALAKTGTGTWTVSGVNTHTGGTTVTVGTLAAGDNSALGTGTLSLNGGTLTASGAARAFANNVNLTASSLLGGTLNLTFNGTFTNTGAFTLTDNNTGVTTLTNVNLSDSVTNRTLTLAGTDINASITGVIANGGGSAASGITKLGTGTWLLAGSSSNTYSGTTAISAGTLSLGKTGGAIAIASNVTIGDGAGTDTLLLSAANQIADTSAVTMTAGGTPTFNLNAFSETIGSLASTNTAAAVQLGTPGAATALTVGDATSTNFSGVISGGANAGLVKQGTGTLTLDGTASNAFAGTTTVNDGTLALGKTGGATAIAGALVIGNGSGSDTVQLNAADQIANTSAVTLSAGGTPTLNLNGFSETIGSLASVNTSAAVQLGAPGAATALTVGDATSTAFAGVISGGANAGLTKQGSGTLTLSGANTFTGATTIADGTLSVASLNNVVAGNASSSLGAPVTVATGTINLGAGATTGTLAYTGAGETTDRVINLAGTTGGGVIDSSGAGVLTFSSDTTATGVGAKTLTLQGSTAGNIFAGVIVDGSGTTSVTKAGAGTWTLSAANTFTGVTTVNAGTLILAKNGGTAIAGNAAIGDGAGTDTLQLNFDNQIASTAAVTFNNTGGTPTLDLNGKSQTLGSIATTNTSAVIALGSPGAATTLTVGDATSTSFAGVISGNSNAAVVKQGSGTLTLSGANTYAGSTTVSAGVLSVQHNSALGTTAGGTTVSGGAALELSNVANGNLTTSAEALTLNGSGISSGGALRNVAGNNTFSGAITLASAARINSDANTLTLTGGLTGTNLDLTIGGSGHTTLSSSLALGTGSLTKDGSGTLAFSGTTATTGQVHLNAGGINVTSGTLTTAEFDSVAGTTLTIASGAQVTANVGSDTIFSGAISAGAGGIFQKDGSATLTFASTFDAGASSVLILNGGTLKLGNTGGVSVTFGTIHITADTTLDFNSSYATTLSSSNLIIDANVNVSVVNWISLSDVWYVTSNINGSPARDTLNLVPLNQITFNAPSAAAATATTWVTAQGGQYFNNEIRPTPEPSTYGAILLGSSLALLTYRRHRRGRTA